MKLSFAKLSSLLVACFLAGSTASGSVAKKARASAVPQTKTNVILITVDTLRADHLGSYGATEVKTPAMDSLAKDGIQYDHAIAQVPLTVPSHDAIMTGTYPFRNGVQDFTSAPLAPEFQTIAQSLHRHGYRTGAVVSAFVLDRTWGLARGFDFYYDAFPASTFEHKDIGLVDRKAGESVDRAIEWLQKQRQLGPHRKPFFFWLHLYDPHSPYDPPEPFATEYKQHLYDGEIAYADNQLGRLFDWLKRSQLYDGALIILASDHGESLGEHGEKEHGFFIYNATTRVPLIMKLPGGPRHSKGSHVTQPVETIDIPPTILASLGISDPILRQFQGHTLPQTDLTSRGVERAAYSETFYPFSSFGWNPLRSLESAHYHYIDAPKPELYDLLTDPQERHNLITEKPAIAGVMKQSLQERVQQNAAAKTDSGNSGLSQETIEKLRSLGYVAYRSPVSAEALAAGLPDPKDKIAEFNTILEAADNFQAGKYSQGSALLESLEEREPAMYVLHFMHAEAALREKDWLAAQAHFEKCLQLNANFDQAMTGLAQALFRQNKIAEARSWLNRALQQNPQNYKAWHELGWAESQDSPAASRKDFEKAVTLQPNFALGHRDLGMLLYEQKDYAASKVHLAKAVELGAADASVYNALGISYSQLNELKRAVDSYKKSLNLDPSLAPAHLNLAYAYERLGRYPEAKTEYEAACRLEKNFCQYVPKENKS